MDPNDKSLFQDLKEAFERAMSTDRISEMQNEIDSFEQDRSKIEIVELVANSQLAGHHQEGPLVSLPPSLSARPGELPAMCGESDQQFERESQAERCKILCCPQYCRHPALLVGIDVDLSSQYSVRLRN